MRVTRSSSLMAAGCLLSAMLLGAQLLIAEPAFEPLQQPPPSEPEALDPDLDGPGARLAPVDLAGLRRQILSKPLFSPSRLPRPATAVPTPAPEAASAKQVVPEPKSAPRPEPPLPRLVGTSVSGSERIALVSLDSEAGLRAAREGESLGPWTLTRIGEGIVTLLWSRQERQVRLCYLPDRCSQGSHEAASEGDDR